MSTAVLQTVGLTKRYGMLDAVRGLSLEIREGEVFGFLGPNGAGKTTAINMMCGLLKPDAGEVRIHGQLVVSAGQSIAKARRRAQGDVLGDVRARVGVCPQDIIVWERLSCIEQLQFVGQMYGMSAAQSRHAGEQLLADLDLADKRSKQARTLSGGMKRRLSLALALVHDPDIVVLDEPEAGLDPQSRIRVREYIRSLARRKTVILTTHNMAEADRVADRIAIIDHGELLVLDTPESLKRSVGTGDVLEISLPAAAMRDECGLEQALAGLPAGATANVANGTLTVRALNVLGLLPAILEALRQSGLQPGEVRLRENSLEDVFIRLTGRRLRE